MTAECCVSPSGDRFHLTESEACRLVGKSPHAASSERVSSLLPPAPLALGLPSLAGTSSSVLQGQHQLSLACLGLLKRGHLVKRHLGRLTFVQLGHVFLSEPFAMARTINSPGRQALDSGCCLLIY